MDTFHTDYKPPENATKTEFCHSGITFKKHMIEHFTKLKAMTICFRINMNYFAKGNNFAWILQLLSRENGDTTDKRTLDFRLG